MGNSNDSFCSSDISLDGSNFDNLDEATSDTLSLQNLDLHTSHIHNNLLDNTAGASNSTNIGNVNPIDKLYLMQNSYFNSEQWNLEYGSSYTAFIHKPNEISTHKLWFQLDLCFKFESLATKSKLLCNWINKVIIKNDKNSTMAKKNASWTPFQFFWKQKKKKQTLI